MNPLYFTIIFSAAALITSTIGSIFVANWSNQRHIDRLMKEFADKYDAKLDALRSEGRERADRLEGVMNARFDKLEGIMNARFDAVNARLDHLEERVSRLELQPATR
jgi:hypothetical protein